MHVCMLSCVRPECFVHEIFQSRILEWITISSSRVSSQPRDQTHITFLSCSCRWILTTEPFGKPTILYTWNQYDILNQFSSIAQSCPTLWDPMDCSTPGLPVHHQLPEPPQTHVHPISDAIQPSHILSSPSPPSYQSFPASGSFLMNWFFTSGGQSIGVSASACPSNEYSGLISFRIDWLDLLAVQGTLKSLLQHHSSKASVLQCEPKKVKSVTASTFPPSICHKVGLDSMISVFWMLSFQPIFFSFLFHLHQQAF